MNCSTRTFILLLVVGLVSAAKPAMAQSPICYAKAGGNDLNDGSYWAFAKADVMACYDSLPFGGGTIFITAGIAPAIPACKATDPPGCGVWIMGAGDPNYSHPPAGWRKRKSTVSIIGVGGLGAGVYLPGGKVPIAAGNNTDSNHPAIWLSNVEAMHFENISIGYNYAPLKISIDSTGNRDGAGGCQQLSFENFAASIGQYPGYGPSVDIGGSTYWVRFRGFTFEGNYTEAANIAPASSGLLRSSNVVTATTSANLPRSWAGTMTIGVVGAADPSFDGNFRATITGARTFTYAQTGPNARSGGGKANSDKNSAVVMNPGRGTGAFVYFENGMVANGGIKDYGGNTGVNLSVADLNQETGTAPPVWVTNCISPVDVQVSNVQIADPLAIFPGLRVDCPASFAPWIAVQATTVDGPATLAGNSNPSSPNIGAAFLGQTGFINGHIIGQTDSARRGFGPVAARWTNRASQVPSSWGNKACTGATAPTAITAPDGTSNAGKEIGTACFYGSNSSPIPSSGDTIIVGVWVRPETTSIPQTSFYCNCDFTSLAGSYTNAQPVAGQWQWIWNVYYIWRASGTIQLDFYSSSASPSIPVDFFAPVLIEIPSGQITQSEAAEMAVNLQSYRDDARPGQVSLMRGEQFKADSIQVGDGPTITSGLGPPKELAPTGSIYLRRDGAVGSSFYIYEKDGWKAQF